MIPFINTNLRCRTGTTPTTHILYARLRGDRAGHLQINKGNRINKPPAKTLQALIDILQDETASGLNQQEGAMIHNDDIVNKTKR